VLVDASDVPGEEAKPSPSHYRLLADLPARLESALPGHLLDVLSESLVASLGIREVRLYLVDYGLRVLTPLPGPKASPSHGEEIPIRGTLAGRALLTRQGLQGVADDAPMLWVPIFQGSEAIGVLGLGAESDREDLTPLVPHLGGIVGAAVLGARRHGDVVDVTRGAAGLSLPAAIQWSLLPIPSYVDPNVQIAGHLEPAYDVAGDSFDFAANEGRLDVAIFDAMGHGLSAALLVSLAVQSYRLARRQDLSLPEIASEIDQSLTAYAQGQGFVTGHLLRLDTKTGSLSWVNAGHLPPVLLRDRSPTILAPPPPGLPFGLGDMRTSSFESAELRLQPGDLLVLCSDGVEEARSGEGLGFGVDRVSDLVWRHGDPSLPLLSLVRLMLDEVLDHVGRELRDDAMVVALRFTR
jgi:hypothetical protein